MMEQACARPVDSLGRPTASHAEAGPSWTGLTRRAVRPGGAGAEGPRALAYGRNRERIRWPERASVDAGAPGQGTPHGGGVLWSHPKRGSGVASAARGRETCGETSTITKASAPKAVSTAYIVSTAIQSLVFRIRSRQWTRTLGGDGDPELHSCARSRPKRCPPGQKFRYGARVPAAEPAHNTLVYDDVLPRALGRGTFARQGRLLRIVSTSERTAVAAFTADSDNLSV
jgi:hypothetical protein